MKRSNGYIAATVLVLCLLMGGWLLRGTPRPPAIVSKTPRPPEAPTAVVAPAQPALAASSTAPPEPLPQHGEGEVEVCGHGFISREATPPQLRHELASEAIDTMQRVSGRLLGSTRAEEAALGHLLAMGNARERAADGSADRLAACGEDTACSAPVAAETLAAARQAARPHLDALAVQPASSNRPAVYAMAVQACGAYDDASPREGGCQLITLERWAQIEPDNAVPWLHLAVAADRRKDSAGAQEALYHASIARVDKLYGGDLLALAEPVLAKGLTDWERAETGWAILGTQAAWTFPSFAVPMKMCSGDALLDSSRHQICDAFTSMMLDRSNTLLEYGIGVRLAERLHWPPDRLEALRKEREVMSMVSRLDAELDDFRCAALTRQTDAALRTSRLGEVGSARARIAATGRTIDDLADEHRRNMASQEARIHAERAAVPAGATSSAPPN